MAKIDLKTPVSRGDITQIDSDNISVTVQYELFQADGTEAGGDDVTVNKQDVLTMTGPEKRAVRDAVKAILKFGNVIA